MEKQNESGVQEDLTYETVLVFEENKRKHLPVPADGIDFWMAVAYAVVGYSFVYVFSSDHFAWKFSVFTAVYAVAVLAYLTLKKRKVPKESWFWLAMMLGSGIPYGFYTAMPFFQVPGTAALAAYWTLSAGGCLIEDGRTSQWAAADFWNSIWKVPFGNFTCFFHVLSGGGEEMTEDQNALSGEVQEKKKNVETAEAGKKNLRRAGVRKLGAILFGVILAVPVLLIVLPLLSSADDNFNRLIVSFLVSLSENVLSFVLRAVCSIPVTAYLFGLIYGCIYRRKTDGIRRESVQAAGEGVRIISDAAVNTALLILSACYVLFIVLQAQYLFSAFAGVRPDTYTYSEYARKGFFELCAVAAVNLAVLLLANLFTKTKREQNRGLRILNLVIAVLTLLLIATAMSKMVLYISAYGLTIKRIITMTFMSWMAVVFLLWCAGQRQKLPLIRAAWMSGTGLYVLLCVLPLEQIVSVFNRLFYG